MSASERSLAIVTGASSGIGSQLAKQCAEHGFDLLIAVGAGKKQPHRKMAAPGTAKQT